LLRKIDLKLKKFEFNNKEHLERIKHKIITRINNSAELNHKNILENDYINLINKAELKEKPLLRYENRFVNIVKKREEEEEKKKEGFFLKRQKVMDNLEILDNNRNNKNREILKKKK